MKHCQRCNTGSEGEKEKKNSQHRKDRKRESEGKKYTTLRMVGYEKYCGKKRRKKGKSE
jgi:hypothetical protein